MRSASIRHLSPALPDTTVMNPARWRWRGATKKGRVERAIRYVRDAFSFAARTFADLDDLHAQAEAWCNTQAADRRCPEDLKHSVREVFAEEAPRLLPLPDNPAPLLERVVVSVGKTPYVRFDLNDYSVPHTHVRRVLTVLADPQKEYASLTAGAVLACHRRSYDRDAQIEQADHVEALMRQKRAARQHRATDRTRVHAAPASQTLLIRAAERGANLGTITAALMRLLAQTSAAEMQAAILEALQRGVPHPTATCAWPWRGGASSAARATVGRRRAAGASTQARDTTVQPHALETYDQYSRKTAMPLPTPHLPKD